MSAGKDQTRNWAQYGEEQSRHVSEKGCGVLAPTFDDKDVGCKVSTVNTAGQLSRDVNAHGRNESPVSPDVCRGERCWSHEKFVEAKSDEQDEPDHLQDL